MKDLDNKELCRVRLRFIDLMKSFFIIKPDAEILSRWRGTFSSLVREQVAPDVDRASKELNTLLTEKKLEDLQDEYYSLFTDPFSEHVVQLTASHLLDGRSMSDSLISLRQLLHDSDIEVTDSIGLPEDTFPVMLDILGTLIEKDQGGEDTAEKQKKLLFTYLLPSAEKLLKAMESNEAALFYTACTRFCRSYLMLEKGLTT